MPAADLGIPIATDHQMRQIAEEAVRQIEAMLADMKATGGLVPSARPIEPSGSRAKPWASVCRPMRPGSTSTRHGWSRR